MYERMPLDTKRDGWGTLRATGRTPKVPSPTRRHAAASYMYAHPSSSSYGDASFRSLLAENALLSAQSERDRRAIAALEAAVEGLRTAHTVRGADTHGGGWGGPGTGRAAGGVVSRAHTPARAGTAAGEGRRVVGIGLAAPVVDSSARRQETFRAIQDGGVAPLPAAAGHSRYMHPAASSAVSSAHTQAYGTAALSDDVGVGAHSHGRFAADGGGGADDAHHMYEGLRSISERIERDRYRSEGFRDGGYSPSSGSSSPLRREGHNSGEGGGAYRRGRAQKEAAKHDSQHNSILTAELLRGHQNAQNAERHQKGRAGAVDEVSGGDNVYQQPPPAAAAAQKEHRRDLLVAAALSVFNQSPRNKKDRSSGGVSVAVAASSPPKPMVAQSTRGAAVGPTAAAAPNGHAATIAIGGSTSRSGSGPIFGDRRRSGSDSSLFITAADHPREQQQRGGGERAVAVDAARKAVVTTTSTVRSVSGSTFVVTRSPPRPLQNRGDSNVAGVPLDRTKAHTNTHSVVMSNSGVGGGCGPRAAHAALDGAAPNGGGAARARESWPAAGCVREDGLGHRDTHGQGHAADGHGGHNAPHSGAHISDFVSHRSNKNTRLGIVGTSEGTHDKASPQSRPNGDTTFRSDVGRALRSDPYEGLVNSGVAHSSRANAHYLPTSTSTPIVAKNDHAGLRAGTAVGRKPSHHAHGMVASRGGVAISGAYGLPLGDTDNNGRGSLLRVGPTFYSGADKSTAAKLASAALDTNVSTNDAAAAADAELRDFCRELAEGIVAFSTPSQSSTATTADDDVGQRADGAGSTATTPTSAPSSSTAAAAMAAAATASDMFRLFRREMGATSVRALRLTVTEADLIAFGVPLLQSRLIMKLMNANADGGGAARGAGAVGANATGNAVAAPAPRRRSSTQEGHRTYTAVHHTSHADMHAYTHTPAPDVLYSDGRPHVGIATAPVGAAADEYVPSVGHLPHHGGQHTVQAAAATHVKAARDLLVAAGYRVLPSGTGAIATSSTPNITIPFPSAFTFETARSKEAHVGAAFPTSAAALRRNVSPPTASAAPMKAPSSSASSSSIPVLSEDGVSSTRSEEATVPAWAHELGMAHM